MIEPIKKNGYTLSVDGGLKNYYLCNPANNIDILVSKERVLELIPEQLLRATIYNIIGKIEPELDIIINEKGERIYEG